MIPSRNVTAGGGEGERDRAVGIRFCAIRPEPGVHDVTLGSPRSRSNRDLHSEITTAEELALYWFDMNVTVLG